MQIGSCGVQSASVAHSPQVETSMIPGTESTSPQCGAAASLQTASL